MASRPETVLNTFSDFKEFKVQKLKEEDAYELIKKLEATAIEQLDSLVK